MESIDGFREFVRLPVRTLHVMRNPFDMVAAAVMNGEWERPYSFLQLIPTVAQMRERYNDENWLDVYHEDVIADPRAEITRILEFLGLPVLEEHLSRCEAYLYKSPHKRRFEAMWPEGLKQQVQVAIQQHDFLSRYSWET